MKKRILLTGAFGNVGQNTLKQLLLQGHKVTCFDIFNSRNEKTFQVLIRIWDFKVIWGDITNLDDVYNAVQGIDCIIHLAAIIPPLSEKNPELSYKINVEGTRNLINAALTLPTKPRFIMASSTSVYGITMDKKPPITLDTPLNPSDHYSNHKVECEKIIKNSGLSWVILRLGAVSVEKLSLDSDISILFEVPLDQRLEFVSSIDCGIAFSNAVSIYDRNSIFLIGGGKACQLTEKEFLKGYFDALGFKMLPESAFKKAKTKDDWIYIDWMDTKESQEVLRFQTESFQEYTERLKREYKWRRLGLKIISPIVKKYLVRKSPYYEE